MFGGAPAIIGYVLLAFMLRPKAEVLRAEPSPAAPSPANESLRRLLETFTRLETRLARIETEVTSSDFDLNRKFKNMGA